MPQSSASTITNFGGNVTFTPKYFYAPKSDEEVLEILNKHKDGHIRVMASLHCWSDAVISKDVLLDLKNLDQVKVEKNEQGDIYVRVGAGKKLKHLAKFLRQNTRGSFPTLGGLMQQTIAGAISTGTHGSGGSSLSNFMEEIKVAAFDKKTNQAKIFTFSGGDELKAARCTLGCMGVIVEVKFKVVPKYWIEEVTKRYSDLKDLLSKLDEFPQTQFLYFPYLWSYTNYQRRITNNQPKTSTQFKMWLNRQYDYLFVELLPHLSLKSILKLTSPNGKKTRLIPWYYKTLVPIFVREGKVINPTTYGLTLHSAHHYTFRHVEMEVFIPEENIFLGTDLVHYLTDFIAGRSEDIPENLIELLKKHNLWEKCQLMKDKYMHHYPYFVRRVFPDETLISMTSGKKTYYAIGFFTYHAPDKRHGYFAYCKFMAAVLVKVCDSRLHWGKYFPLNYEDVYKSFPEFDKFHKLCNEVDPRGVFRNDYTTNILGFKQSKNE